MALTQVTAGDTAQASDVNQFKNALEGAAGATVAYHLRLASSQNLLVTLPDAGGSQKLSIRDSGSSEIFHVNSDGDMKAYGTGITVGTHTVGALTTAGTITTTGVIVAGSGAKTLTTSAGLLKHEVGGLEFDASAITTGGMIKGDSSGVMEVLAKGAANTLLTMNAGATDFAWTAAVAGGAMTHEGSQLTEASSNSTSQADLISVTSLDIVAAKPIIIRASIRKTSGTGGSYSFGLTLNSNNLVYAGSGGTTGLATLTTTSAEASSLTIYVPPRTTNYLRAIHVVGGTARNVLVLPAYNADAPTANITSITITWNGVNADTTGYADDMHVYTVATE